MRRSHPGTEVDPQMSSFFEELKRRKVYRVAVGYVVVAGGIIQLASAVFPAWQLPDWVLRVVVFSSSPDSRSRSFWPGRLT